MPRNGSGVYSKPAGATAVSGATIDSSDFNTLIDDLVSDANAARPVSAGGTGETSLSALRTALGLGTGDSPQFTAINVGDASDSTITRVSAGLLAIEGSNILTAANLDADLTAIAALSPSNDDFMQRKSGAWANRTLTQVVADLKPYLTESIGIAVGSDAAVIAAGTGKFAFRMPYAFTVTAVRASLATAQTSGNIVTIDINEAGTTILSTKLTIDNNEKTSTTAATAAVISDASLADDAEITIDIDQIGNGTAAGLKVYLIGYRT